MPRLDLHKAWLEHAISVRLKYKSYTSPVGKEELDTLQQDLARTIQQMNDTSL